MFIINALAAFGNWFWGLPILIVVLGGGLIINFYLGFPQIKRFGYMLSQTFGTMFKKNDKEGVSSFAAACAALAASVGASNIVGVPVAIALGGPGAVFWILMIALLGCATKYVEVILGVRFREKDANGEWAGGPFYYCKAIGGKLGLFLGYFFSIALMLEIVPSVASQCLSATSQTAVFGMDQRIVGVLIAIVTCVVVLGGFNRVADTMNLMVPIMSVIYMAGALVVIIVHANNILPAIASIFAYAFRPHAAMGGFVGSVVAATIRWGAARGVYSNEAGFGEAAVAHAGADVDHPVRQGFWGMFEVTVDTLLICNITALAVLTSGAWTMEGVENGALAQAAFATVFGNAGNYFVAICVFLFVLSTVIVIAFYGQKQSETLFGAKGSKIWFFVYPAMMIIAAFGMDLTTAYSVTDALLGFAIIPNMIGCVYHLKEVKKLQDEYFNTPGMYYLADMAAKEAKKAAKAAK
ncbi:MAG: sodium:alanine symporter family protein [Mogibacterium sp.]|nr:sodium:alanine symporter family protein [Mogibacterium sp.]